MSETARPRCPSCMIGLGESTPSYANPALIEGVLVIVVREGYRCSVCAHRWAVGPPPALPRGREVCDFCLDPQPVVAFPCRDFVVEDDGRTDTYSGGWAACAECARLVSAGDREGLLNRSVLSFIKLHPQLAAAMPPGELTRDILRRQDGFWRYRL